MGKLRGSKLKLDFGEYNPKDEEEVQAILADSTNIKST